MPFAINPVVMVLFLFISPPGCTRQEGIVTGTVSPPAPGIRVSALQNGKTVSLVPADARDGTFSMKLAPGTYDINISAPDFPLPMVFYFVSVEQGKTTELSPIAFAGSSVREKGALSGRITPARPGASITLLAEGKERASTGTDSEGNYSFKGVPAGFYDLQVRMPDYAPEVVPVAVAAENITRYNPILFYASAVEGVDWAAGKLRVIGQGFPPHTSANPTVSRELARRAALTDAQRKLLKALSEIKTGPDEMLQSRIGEKKFSRRIEGFIKGYHIVGERDRGGGAIEIDVELVLTGKNGLSRYLSE